MASDPLTSTYKRYKASTDKFVKWLQDSAEPSTTVPKPIKGRRKPKKKPPVDSYVGLAKAIIAATDPRVEIPLDILDTTKDVIRGRKAAAEWYRGLTGQETLNSNRTHRHFLGVNEEAFEHLRIEHRARQPKRKKKVELPTDSSDLGNVFAQLQVEETTHASKSTPSRVRTPRHQAAPPARSERETMPETESMEEKLFAIWCHFKDLFEIRVQSRETWKQYYNGDVSFLTACQTFDSAVRIAVTLSKEFSTANPDLKGFEDMMTVLGEQEYIRSARYHQFRYGAGIVEELNVEEREQFLCMPAWCALQDIDELSTIMFSGEDLNTHHPVSVFHGHPFGKQLLNVIGDLCDVLGFLPENPEDKLDDAHIELIGDEYTRQLISFIAINNRLDQKKSKLAAMPTGLLIGTQMYMDLCDVLDGDLDRGWRGSWCNVSAPSVVSPAIT
ncbi:hypothetical protein Slin15195_G073680 [Septoria linicola]|uniref:DUF6604 domain-containing protein n=1 Tax=Septoria linicola TaxID=215465 RepID=A0A9Q9ARF1_9PEZI|nr:hypothetical protein Slin15195_G073680 [Septoria linicola]